MYGKIFKEIYGSTVAEFGGDTMYVLMSMVVLSDAGGYLRMTVTSLARTIRKDVEIVRSAIANLEADDPESSSKDYEGRRIIKLSEVTKGQENRGWWVINKVKYAQIASQKERLEKNKQRQQRFRDKQGQTVTHHNASLRLSRHVDEDVDLDLDLDLSSKTLGQKNPFDLFWLTYPKKVKRKKAVEIWKRRKLDDRADVLIADVKNRLAKDDRWINGYVPDPTTYLNGDLWEDEIQFPTQRPENLSKSQVLRIGSQKGLRARPGESHEEYATRVRMTRGN